MVEGNRLAEQWDELIRTFFDILSSTRVLYILQGARKIKNDDIVYVLPYPDVPENMYGNERFAVEVETLLSYISGAWDETRSPGEIIEWFATRERIEIDNGIREFSRTEEVLKAIKISSIPYFRPENEVISMIEYTNTGIFGHDLHISFEKRDIIMPAYVFNLKQYKEIPLLFLMIHALEKLKGFWDITDDEEIQIVRFNFWTGNSAISFTYKEFVEQVDKAIGKKYARISFVIKNPDRRREYIWKKYIEPQLIPESTWRSIKVDE